jgi:asparagine synthase (glutamine-hydrolysing)
MSDVLRHRGPDGRGEFKIGAELAGRRLEGWLGHRRLKIIDLSDAAHQPMASDDGSIVVTYNGEIYNFRELRRELETAGHRFRSTGDTEVIVRGYEEWGDGLVSRLDGMFAFGLWDGRRGRMLLARDRAGKKPLFYTTRGGRLSFASEIKSLLCLQWVDARADASAVPELLTFGYVPNPRTMYEGIVQVPPASVVAYDFDGPQPPHSYWNALPSGQMDRVGPNVTGEIASLLEDATRRRLISDVPLGALLSGGVDSSVVVGLMSRHLGEPVRTFSIGFSDADSYDERTYARMVAAHFRTVHTEFVVEANAVALLERLLWHHDQPFADSSAIPTYLVCELASEHVTVALNGDGGDEVFGGYDRFVAAAIAERVPRLLTHAARGATSFLPLDHGYYNLRRRAERFAAHTDMPAEDRYQAWIAILNEELLNDVLNAAVRRTLEEPVARSMLACYEQASHLPQLDRILYANFKTYLPDDLAVKMDRMSMAHSLETRSPFLDTALVEYLARVPARRKVGLRRVKPLLRQAFWPLLPREIWNRKKHGFGVPMNRWFMGELGVMFADEVLAADARCTAYVQPHIVRRLWEEHQRGDGFHGPAFWTLLTLERWLRAAERPPSMSPPTADVMSA